MSWEYRVVRRKYPLNDGATEVAYTIHEYYTDTQNLDGKGSITGDPVYPQGETPEELKVDMQRMMLALNKPSLLYEAFLDPEE